MSNNSIITITTCCPFCKKEAQVTVDAIGFTKWTRGEGSIQDCLPKATPSEREALMTGICDECFPY